jgi:hypothetical protein
VRRDAGGAALTVALNDRSERITHDDCELRMVDAHDQDLDRLSRRALRCGQEQRGVKRAVSKTLINSGSFLLDWAQMPVGWDADALCLQNTPHAQALSDTLHVPRDNYRISGGRCASEQFSARGEGEVHGSCP